MEDDDLFFQTTFNDILISPNDQLFENIKRPTCQHCERPVQTCLCSHLPDTPLKLKQTTVYVLQHINEIKRPLGTVQLLTKCLDKESLNVIRSKNFSSTKYPCMKQVYNNPYTLLLFPNQNSSPLDELLKEDFYKNKHITLVAIDGTWNEATGIFNRHNELINLKTCYLKIDKGSEFVIRTQPTEKTMSTIESIAHSLKYTEQNDDIYDIIVRPLKRMVSMQLDMGACYHHDKLTLINNNEFKKKCGKKQYRRLLALQH